MVEKELGERNFGFYFLKYMNCEMEEKGNCPLIDSRRSSAAERHHRREATSPRRCPLPASDALVPCSQAAQGHTPTLHLDPPLKFCTKAEFLERLQILY